MPLRTTTYGRHFRDWGPTDRPAGPYTASLSIFRRPGGSRRCDTVTMMLFHTMRAVARFVGAGANLVAVGPPTATEEVAVIPQCDLWACKPFVDARGLKPGFDQRVNSAA